MANNSAQGGPDGLVEFLAHVVECISKEVEGVALCSIDQGHFQGIGDSGMWT